MKYEDLHVPEIPDGAATGGDWVGGQINAGDVLMFHSLTVHAGSPNLSNRLRISLDCRFQDHARIFNPANLAFAGESGKSWEKTYAGLAFRNAEVLLEGLPLSSNRPGLRSKFSRREAESPSIRARYARILSQMD